MADQETATTGRRTRSRAAKATPVKAEKATPRKTRKKVVLMEVEVSEEEEETVAVEEKSADGDESGPESVKEGPAPNKKRKVTSDEVKNGETEQQDLGAANENNIDTEQTNMVCEVELTNVAKQDVSNNPLKKSDNLNGDGKALSNENIEKEQAKEQKVEKIASKREEVVDKVKSEEPENQEKPAGAEKETEKPVQVKQLTVQLEKTDSPKVEADENQTENPKVVEENKKTDNPEQVGDKTENVEKVKGDEMTQKSVEEDKADEKVEKNAEKTVETIKKEKTPEVSDNKSVEVDEVEVKIEDIKMEVDQIKSEVEDVADAETEEEHKPADTEEKDEVKSQEDTSQEKKNIDAKTAVDPDAENISEDELPGVPVVKVPEAEEVSDEELPGPKRAELPADTEVVSEDELPSVKTEKKEGKKRKLDEAGYDPGSPTSESETPSKKAATETSTEKEKEKSPRPKKLPELDKYWKAVNDDPTDFTGWTYLLQYVDQENDMEAAREAYDAFLSHYPYCYGYWRKYADYEKRKGNKKKCEEVFERGLKAIPLSVDLWIHYLTYVKTTRTSEEDYIRSQFERALTACGLEFRSDRLWDSYIKWETEGKRLQRVTAIYDKLLSTPTQGYTTHFDNFQEHISSNPPNKVIEVDEFLALRKEVRHMLKHDITTEPGAVEKEEPSDAPPGDEEPSKITSTDEETKAIRERIVSIRRKAHKATVNAVTSRWNYEEGIKRPYFHVKPLERCQLKNWHDYLDYESEQGDRTRIIVLFERCLIACALYEEFWMKFVHYLENLKDPELQTKIRDVYERACTIHHLKKPNLHLQWAMFEEGIGNVSRAAEILVNLEKSVPNILQIAYRRINLERRRGDFEKCSQLYDHYISNSKNKMVSSNIAIKYSRFCLKVAKDISKAQEVLKTAVSKDPNNPRLYLQLIDLTLQKDNVVESEIIEIIDSFLDKDSTDSEQKVLFAQRKLEYLEDFGSDIQSVQQAYETYQKYAKMNKENVKKKEVKSESTTSTKNEKGTAQAPAPASSYSNYSSYGNTGHPPYSYSGVQQGQYNYSQYGQGDQYQYQNWQYPQGGYGGYNQWGGYGGGYSY